MAATYAPAAHTAPTTAAVGSVNITGLSPARVFTALNDQWAPTTIFLPTGTTADGFPGAMLPFPTGTGAVT